MESLGAYHAGRLKIRKFVKSTPVRNLPGIEICSQADVLLLLPRIFILLKGYL